MEENMPGLSTCVSEARLRELETARHEAAEANQLNRISDALDGAEHWLSELKGKETLGDIVGTPVQARQVDSLRGALTVFGAGLDTCHAGYGVANRLSREFLGAWRCLEQAVTQLAGTLDIRTARICQLPSPEQRELQDRLITAQIGYLKGMLTLFAEAGRKPGSHS